jgi:co-chaperonin GroES (HSP10)
VDRRAALTGPTRYTSQEIKLDGEEFLIMREDEVLAVVETP